MDLLHAPEKPGDGRSRNLSHHRRLTCTAGPVALEGRPGPGADADLRGHLGQRLPHTCEVGRTAQEARAAGLGLFPLGKQTKREWQRGGEVTASMSSCLRAVILCPACQPRTEKPLVPPLTQAAALFRRYGRSRCAPRGGQSDSGLSLCFDFKRALAGWRPRARQGRFSEVLGSRRGRRLKQHRAGNAQGHARPGEREKRSS